VVAEVVLQVAAMPDAILLHYPKPRKPLSLRNKNGKPMRSNFLLPVPRMPLSTKHLLLPQPLLSQHLAALLRLGVVAEVTAEVKVWRSVEAVLRELVGASNSHHLKLRTTPASHKAALTSYEEAAKGTVDKARETSRAIGDSRRPTIPKVRLRNSHRLKELWGISAWAMLQHLRSNQVIVLVDLFSNSLLAASETSSTVGSRR
jgi:hypothetical protein